MRLPRTTLLTFVSPPNPRHKPKLFRVFLSAEGKFLISLGLVRGFPKAVGFFQSFLSLSLKFSLCHSGLPLASLLSSNAPVNLLQHSQPITHLQVLFAFAPPPQCKNKGNFWICYRHGCRDRGWGVLGVGKNPPGMRKQTFSVLCNRQFCPAPVSPPGILPGGPVS